MAGLGVILEPKKSLPKCPQILSKVTSFKPPSSSLNAPPPPPPLPTSPCMSPFLESCFLCHQPLSQTKDIYMYRGDRAFCSEECRCRQIYMDEETVVRDNCSVAAVGGGAAACRRGKKAREASGFAY